MDIPQSRTYFITCPEHPTPTLCEFGAGGYPLWPEKAMPSPPLSVGSSVGESEGCRPLQGPGTLGSASRRPESFRDFGHAPFLVEDCVLPPVKGGVSLGPFPLYLLLRLPASLASPCQRDGCPPAPRLANWADACNERNLNYC